MALTRPTAAQINTTSSDFSDPLILINKDQTGINDKDIGFVFERGSDTNVGIVWDESANEFALINSTEDGTTEGNVTISSYAPLQVSSLTVNGAILPSANVTYDLGSSTLMWKDIYVGPGSLYVNNKKVISDDTGTITVSTDADENLVLKTTGTGQTTIQSATGVNLTATNSGDVTVTTSSGNIELKGTVEVLSGKTIIDSAGDNVAFGSSIKLNGQTDLRFADADSTNYIGFQAPGSIASNLIWTLPSIDGTSNQVLSTDGNGNLSFISAAGSPGGIDTQVQFNDNGLFSGSANLTFNGTTLASTGFSGPLTGNVTGDVTGNADTASAWATARTITLGGVLSGNVSIDGSSNVTLTASHTSDPVITLTGDVTGSATMTNLGNVSITATVADDSHNHTIANVDGLQTALDAKAPLANPALSGTPTAPTASSGTNTTQIATTAFVSSAVSDLVNSAPSTLDTLNELAAALGDDPNFATTVTNSIATKLSLTGGTLSGDLNLDGNDIDGVGTITGALNGNATTATSLATARTIGGVSFDGTSNINLPGVNTTGNQDTSGNAATATSLATARTIGGVSFDGTSNINLPGVNTTGNQDTTGNAATATVAARATNVETNANNSTNESTYIAFVDGATGSQGIETDTGLRYNPLTNTVTASFSGALSGNASTATALQTARTIGGVSFNGTSNIDLPGVNTVGNQNTTGSAATLTTPRTIGLSGDVTATGVAFDGSGNITLTTEMAANSVDLTTHTTGNYVAAGSTSGNGISGSVSSEGGTFTVTSNATSAADASTIVYRDASGNFSAGTITADLSGNATTATTATNITANANNSNNESTYIAFVDGATGSQGIETDTGLRYNPLTNTLTATSFSGNATTATTLQTARTIGGVSFNGSANINLPGVDTTGNQNTTGSAASLTTSRTIALGGDLSGSTSFDGSSDVTITATVANNSHTHTIANVTGLQTALDAKLDSSAFTGTNILNQIKTVDGASSGLDADLLDGQQGSYYLDGNNFINLPAGYGGWTVSDGTNSENIADGNTLEFASAGATDVAYSTSTNTLTVTTSAADILTQIKTVDGASSGLDADLLDGQQGSYYTTYADNAVANLVASAPGTLDTLNELAAALGDDPNFATTVSTQIGTKADKTITISAGGGLTGGGDLSANRTISHADTSSQASVNNSAGTVIQDITLDGYGHITAIASTNLDGRYYTESEADSRFVNTAGDTLTGTLNYRMLQNQSTSNYDIAGDASGFSVFYGTSTATNKPSGTDHAVATFSYSDAWQTQLAMDWRTNSAYLRTQENGTWKGWNQLFTDGYHPNADKWTTARTLSLSGDASGSVSWDGSANATLSVAVANDSHTHDGRYYTESEADSRFVNVTGDTITGTLTTNNLTIGSGNRIQFANNDYIRYDDANGVGRFHFDSDGGTNNASVQAATFVGALSGNATTASALATPRNIALTGAVTGNANFDGSGNISISTTATSDPTLTINGDASGSATFTNLGNATLTLTVADDSHNHVISNIDGLQTALDGKLSTTGKAADSNLLDGINSTQFLRSDANDTTSGNLTVSGTFSAAGLSYPSSDGTIGQVIVTDGSGNLTFADQSGGSSYTASSSTPSSPNPGDEWWDTDDGSFYKYIDDGISEQWVEWGPNNSLDGSELITGNLIPDVGNTYDIGSATKTLSKVYATATSAQYADLAENYLSDCDYPVGTVLEIGGTAEVTAAKDKSYSVVGTVSDKPAYLMNSGLTGEYVVPVAYIGRVPCRVVGKVHRGDLLKASSTPGVAQRVDPCNLLPGQMIGKALESYNSDQEGIIEIMVGRL